MAVEFQGTDDTTATDGSPFNPDDTGDDSGLWWFLAAMRPAGTDPTFSAHEHNESGGSPVSLTLDQGQDDLHDDAVGGEMFGFAMGAVFGASRGDGNLNVTESLSMTGHVGFACAASGINQATPIADSARLEYASDDASPALPAVDIPAGGAAFVFCHHSVSTTITSDPEGGSSWTLVGNLALAPSHFDTDVILWKKEFASAESAIVLEPTLGDAGTGYIAVIVLNPAGGTANELVADSGSYAITGADTPLERSVNLVADSGSYAITGADTPLELSAFLEAEAGSYAITGAETLLDFGKVMPADAGSYAITGADTPLERGVNLVADAGSYAITGAETDLDLSLGGNELIADAGSYAITGADVVFDLSFSVDGGTYAITGADTPLDVLRQLVADSGSYAITGPDVPLNATLFLAADSGSYAITGADTALDATGVPIIGREPNVVSGGVVRGVSSSGVRNVIPSGKRNITN